MFQTRWQNWRQFSLILLVVFSGMLIHPGAPVHAADITVNATCSLSDAIKSANTDTATGGCPAGSGADTISLSGNLANVGDSEGLNVTSDITILGNAYSVTARGGDASLRRLFRVSARAG